MQCKQIDNLMMKYFDENISELELEQLLRHTNKCTTCAAEFEALKDAIYEIENLPDIEPPEDLTSNIMAAVSLQRHVHIDSKLLSWWLLGFIGLVLFTFNIISYVVIPAMGGTPLVSFQSVIDLVYSMITYVSEGFAAISLSLGKLTVLRDVIFRDYTPYVLLWVGMLAAADVLLYRVLSLKKKTDLV